MSTPSRADVLVIGAGPAGAAAAAWLADAGHDVVLVDRRTPPRDKTCGDALTPRAVTRLAELGLLDRLDRFHRTNGVRLVCGDQQRDVRWPVDPVSHIGHGIVARRRDLDAMLVERALGAGATMLAGHEAVAPVIERGFVRGAVLSTLDPPPGLVRRVDARFIVVADGANSRFGRALGTFRDRDLPYATAIRGYWASPRHAEPWLESVLELSDRRGEAMPGYGWVFPAGDGTLNVGIGLLSTARDFAAVNTTHLLEQFVEGIAERWGIEPSDPTGRPVSGRIPMGGSVAPKAGPTYLVVGDAAGAASPFNGAGIEYALETGRLAAEVIGTALRTGDVAALQQYPRRIEAAYGRYFEAGRLLAQALGRPAVVRRVTRAGLRSRTGSAAAMRIMTNLLRPDERSAADAAFRAAAAVARLIPGA